MKKLKEFRDCREIQDAFFIRTNMPGVYNLTLNLMSEKELNRVSGGATDKGFISGTNVYINEDISINEGFAIFMHEIFHFILNAEFRMSLLGIQYDQNKRMIYNIAQDIIINDMVIAFKKFTKDVPETSWFIDNQEKLLNEVSKITGKTHEDILKMSSENIYGALVSNIDPTKQNGEGEGDGDGDGAGKGQDCSDPNKASKNGSSSKGSSNDKLDKESIEKAFKEFTESVKELNKKVGNGLTDITSPEEVEKQKTKREERRSNLPTEWLYDGIQFKEQMVKEIGNINSNWLREFNIANGVKIPWDKIISKRVRSYFKGYQDLSFKRQNIVGNRIMNRTGRRACLPSYVKNKPLRLGVVVDTSCSINQENLDKFLSIINSYLKHFKGSDCRVISIDTKINTDQIVDKVDKIKVVGGGGTDLIPAIEELDEDPKIKNIFIFTDGYTPWPSRISTAATIVLDGVSETELEGRLPHWGRKIYTGY